MAESAVGQKFALLGQVQIIKILIFKVAAVDTTIVTQGCLLILYLFFGLADLGELVVNVFLHGHQEHGIQLLEIFHDGLLAEDCGQVGGNIVSSILLSEVQGIIQ